MLASTAAFVLPACGDSGDDRYGSGSDSSSGGGNQDGSGGTGGGSGGGLTNGAGGTTNTPGTGGSADGTGGYPGNVDHPPPLTSGCDGWASRYWDCCKPHCAWTDNAGGAGSPMLTCSAQNQVLSDPGTQSACPEPQGGSAYTCYNNAPWAVSNTLAYGYVATHGGQGDHCGRCFQIQFKGSSHNAGDDPGSTALSGKTMIVQATNIGYDVSGDGQFDLMIPGGGVGAFEKACPAQWGVQQQDLGQTHGGFLATCKQQNGGAGHAAIKNCVRQKCDEIFEDPSRSELKSACHWFVDWFEAADNPNFLYKEVPCPDALVNRTTMDRRSINDIQDGCFG